MSDVVASGAFVEHFGGVIEESAEVLDRRPHPDHQALLSVVDGEEARLYVAPGLTHHELDTLSEWAAAAMDRALTTGLQADPWHVGTLPDGRGCAQMWTRQFLFPAL